MKWSFGIVKESIQMRSVFALPLVEIIDALVSPSPLNCASPLVLLQNSRQRGDNFAGCSCLEN